LRSSCCARRCTPRQRRPRRDRRPSPAGRAEAGREGLADDFEVFIPDDGSNLWFRVGRDKEWNVFEPMESVEWSAVPATVNERSRNSIRWQ
jgi:hypothetical protein